MHSAVLTRSQLNQVFGESVSANRNMEDDILQSVFVGGLKNFSVLPHEYDHFRKKLSYFGDKITLKTFDQSVYENFRNYFIGRLCKELLHDSNKLTPNQKRVVMTASFLMEAGLAVRQKGAYIATCGIPQLRIDDGAYFSGPIRSLLSSFTDSEAGLPHHFKVVNRDQYLRLLDLLDLKEFDYFQEAQLELSFAKDTNFSRVEQTGRDLCRVSKGRLFIRKAPMKMVQNFLNRAEGFGDILEDLFKGSTIDLDKNLVVYDSSYITAGFESQQEFTLN